ncbi:YveK family protein [Chengkuizengella axinellae]|uniref:Wzz/FepE/Etk N-terminal domain-containing protein n=1 Tax=Chengkuizengella axinellae TaxID=3064388 RepID=A0ABT9IZB7_9BACL|nr:Wzz/FepE/Etk N-terminal domain-containing protein [Chengkuizengella sp. 2205SS18-9]MDP5274706.1 Wzz/FepE/Etk N-terminal domain-containing protein [Chengkuizengella sp. 2205SS18-9]
MEEEIDLKQILQIIIKKLWIIISITLVAALISGLISYYVLTPTYKSSAQILVAPTNSDLQPFNSSDIRFSLDLISTYRDIIKSPFILEQVVERLEIEYSTGYLNSLITLETASQSQVFTIEVLDEDSNMAAKLTNTIAQVFKENMVDLMNVDNVTILAEAKESSSPVSPNPILNIALSIAAAILVSLVLIFLIEFFDNSVKTEQDIDHLDLQVLGTVNKIGKLKEKKTSKKKNIEVGNERGITLES